VLIPIGLDQDTVRRLPWVSFTIIGLNLLAFVALAPQVHSAEEALAKQRAETMEFWSRHPYLPFPKGLMPGGISDAQREKLNLLTESVRSMTGRAPDDEREVEKARQQLDQLVNGYRAALAEHPLMVWGLVPANPRAVTWLTSLFVHAGFLHLLGNLLFFYLSGPFIEDAFGRPLFLVLYLASGAVANLAHLVSFPHSQAPLIGASGAIAGIMGAFLVRFATRKIRFFYFYFFFLIRSGTVELPAWIVLPLWLAQQLFFAGLTAESGVAYRAHVGGFVFGFLFAFVIKQLGVEERFIAPKIEGQISVKQHPALEEGLDLMAKGDTVAARKAFQKVLAAEPRHPDAHLAIWQSHCQDGTAAQGVAHVAAVIDEDLRRRDFSLAFEHWHEMVADAKQGGPPALRWRLAATLEPENREAAVEVLKNLAEDPAAGVIGEKAARHLTALGASAPQRAAAPPPAEFHAMAQAPPAAPVEPPPVNASMERKAPAPAAVAVAPNPVAIPPRVPTVPSAPLDQPVATALLEDVFPLPPVDEAPAAQGPLAIGEPAPLEIEQCTIESLQEEGLMLRGAQGGPELLPFDEVEKVAVAGITGTGGERPYLVLDLILRRALGGTRRVERLESTHLDPRHLLGRTDLAPLAAFREMVRIIAEGARARTLPPTLLVPTEKIPTFTTVADYEREVLVPSC
jgi:membrane associated rhomboid family serine protease